MNGPTYATIILDLTHEIDTLTSAFVFQGYQALASALARPIAFLCVLFIILTGYGILQGQIKMSLQTLSKMALRMGVVSVFALNWSFFSEYVVTLFTQGASELGAVLLHTGAFKLPYGEDINHGLQQAFVEIVRVASWTGQKGSLRQLGPLFVSFMIYLSGIAVVGLALFEFIIAKLMLSICLCTAPLFISFALFESTKGFFDRWLGTMTGFSLVFIFVSVVVGLIIHLLHFCIMPHYQTHAQEMVSAGWIPLLLVSGLSVMAILEVVSIAKSIGGHCSTGNGSSMVGGFLGAAMGTAASGKGFTQKLGGTALGVGKSMLPGGAALEVGKAMLAKSSNTIKSIQKRMRG